jgi:hypothetical protein
LDPSGLLKDRTWLDFLHSSETGHARPQRRLYPTWIVTALVVIPIGAIIVLDALRVSHAMAERAAMTDRVTDFVTFLSRRHDLALSPRAIPDGNTEIAFLVMRIVILILICPVTILSHHATIFMPGRCKYLRTNRPGVYRAKLAGLATFILGVAALIIGAGLRHAEPWFSADQTFGESSFPNETFGKSTLEDRDPICANSVGGWSLLQLAGAPVLAEAHGNPKYAKFYRWFAELLGISLLEDNPNFGFNTTAFIGIDTAGERIIVAPPALSFTETNGINLENLLPTFYGAFLEDCVPFYGIASEIFMSSLLAGPAEAFTTGILGPNRVTIQSLINATLSVKQELEVASEIMDALGLLVDRPVFVGHGGTGLIAKALQFLEGINLWRVAFESPALPGSPMATLSGASENDNSSDRIFNYFGDGSLFANYDDGAWGTFKIPVFPAARRPIPRPRELIPVHVLRSFCQVQAACGDDSRLDDMCERAFPGEFIFGMCLAARRVRIPHSD